MWFSPVDRRRFNVYLTIVLALCNLSKKITIILKIFLKILYIPYAYSAMKIYIGKTGGWIEMWFIPVDRGRFKENFTIALAPCILRKKNLRIFQIFFIIIVYLLCAMKMNIGKTTGWIEVRFLPVHRKRFKVYLTIALAPCIFREKKLAIFWKHFSKLSYIPMHTSL